MTFFGVYRVLKNGTHRYVPRTATTNEKLAKQIADDLSFGLVVMPDGSSRLVPPLPHVVRPISPEGRA